MKRSRTVCCPRMVWLGVGCGLAWACILTCAAAEEPLSLYVTRPWYRNCIYATESLEAVVCTVYVNLDPATIAGGAIDVEFRPAGSGGQPLAEISKPAATNVAVSLPVASASLADGEYELKATLVLAEGKGGPYSSSVLIKKLPQVAHEWRLNEKNVLLHNGTPFFMTAMYGGNPNGYEDNLNTTIYYLTPYQSEAEALDWLNTTKPGEYRIIYPWPSNSMKEDYSEPLTDADAEALRNRVLALKDHPAILGWYIYDEPEQTQKSPPPEKVQRVYEVLKEADPYHPTFTAHCNDTGLQKYGNFCDMVLMDKYMVWHYGSDVQPDNYMHGIAKYLDRGQVWCGEKRGFGLISALSCNRNNEHTRPASLTELRNISYQGITHNVKGVGYFTESDMRNYVDPRYAVPWLNEELLRISPYVFADRLPGSSVSVSAPYMSNIHVSMHRHNGKTLIIAVNTYPGHQRVTFTFSTALGGSQLHVVSEGREIALSAGNTVLEDDFGVYDTHIYTDDDDLSSLPGISVPLDQIRRDYAELAKPGNLAHESRGTEVAWEDGKSLNPWKIIDGMMGTSLFSMWLSSDWFRQYSFSAPEWVELQWNQTQTIGRVVVGHRTLKDFKVQIPSGSGYTTIASKSGLSGEGMVESEFAPVSTKAIRILVEGIQSGEREAQIYEVEAYANDEYIAFIAAGADDAEERLDTGAVSLESTDLELVRDDGGPADQLVGLRFASVAIPRQAAIDNAWLEFTTDETASDPTALTIQGEASDNAAPFTTEAGNLSARPRTSASVPWAPGAWSTVGEAHRSPGIAPVLQELVDRSQWQSGNALALLIGGTGKRVAESYNGDANKAPVLCVAWRRAPAIAVSTTDISVYAPQGSDCPDASFQVWNSLGGTLQYDIVEQSSKLSVAPAAGSSTGPDNKRTHTISFTTANLLEGIYERQILVQDAGSGARNGPITIAVHIEIGPPPPEAPTGLRAAALSATSVRLSWNDLPDETEYMLRRSLDGEYWYSVDAVYPPADTTEYTVTGLAANTAYDFKLRGINDSGLGAYCEPVRVTSTRVSAGAFDAYNDLCWTASQPAANVTVLTRAESGALRDYGTGEYIPVTLTLNAGGGTSSAYGADAAAGTEADLAFGGIVDGRGVLHYAQTELTLTIAGLDSARLYELTLFGNRANPGYTARTTILTLEGAHHFVNASSPDVTVTTTTMTDDTAVIVNGNNTANGAVARYDRIVPGADGEILVRVPAWSGSGNAGRYYLNALRLRTVEPPPVTLARGAEWRYRKGTAEASEPASAWRQAAFDDSGWARGSAPVGYGAPAAGGTVLSDMRYNYTSIFVRRTFEVTDPLLVGAIDIEVDYDDGFILWLNGREVARVNVAGEPGSFVPCNATASTHGNSTLKISLTGAQLPKLVAGPNAIAAQVFNISLAGSSDCVFDAELDVVLDPPSRSTDADQNNLADDWEQAHLSDLSDPADRSDSGDPDGDGACNLEEWVAGSDPRVPGSVFGVQVGVQGGQVVVSFVTVPATGPGYDGLTRHYALESRPADSTSEWRAVPGSEDIPGAGQTVTFTAGPEVDARFYRSRVWLE